MTELSALNVKITGDAGDLKAAVSTATGELNKVAAAAGKANTASAGLSSGLANTTKAAGSNAHALRGITQQLSQVGQQTMATGNFMQALAIQLPDIGLAFGAVGTAAGLLAGIALPMLASAFSRTADQTKPLVTSVEGLQDSVSNYIEAANAAKLPTSELAAEYGNLAVQAKAALTAIADVALVDAITAADAAVQTIIDSLINIQTFSNKMQVSVLADDFGLAREEAEGLRDALVNLRNAEGLQAQAEAAAEVQRQLLAAFGSVEAMPGPLQRAYGAMASIVIEAGKVVTETTSAETAAEQLATQMDAVIAKYAMSRTIAGQLAQATLDAAKNAATLAQMQLADRGMVYGKVGARGDPTKTTPAGASPFVYGGPNLDAFNNPIAGRGGGGGAANPIQGQLEALQESLMSQEQLQMESYARQQETLKQALDARLVSQQDYANLMQQVEATHQAKMGSQMRAGVATTIGALSQLFNKSKPLAIASALVNTWQGMTEALKLPFPKNIAAAATTLATGMNAVRNIRSTSPGGGGSASGSISAGGGGAGMAGGANAAPQQTSNISLQLVGGDLFSRDQVLRLINSINEATADGARISLR
jgi:hypothetical protein